MDREAEILEFRQLAHHRRAVIGENDGLMNAIVKGGHFGGNYSLAIANRMYSRSNQAAIDDARNGTEIESHGDGVWLIRFPIVNVAAFETDDGLVLIDAGYGPAGPALVDACAQISEKPVHTIVLSHFHCDHAFGAWALFEAGQSPQIVTTAAFVAELQADIDTAGMNVRYTNQHPADVPTEWDPAFTPTVTFHDRLTLRVGGLDFELTHARGETADQLWVHVPERSAVVSADYYQPFLPNAGNGKRRQRHLREWAGALHAMAECDPAVVLPMHGPALTDRADIQDRLRGHSAILNSVVDQALAGLNSGGRRQDVVDSVVLPPEHADRPDVAEQYGTIRDLANMAAHQYTGWWDGVPSHWTPPSLDEEAAEVAALAGGAARLAARADELAAAGQVELACQLADWATMAAPEDLDVAAIAMRIYSARVEAGTVPTQEALIYLDHLGKLRALLQGDG